MRTIWASLLAVSLLTPARAACAMDFPQQTVRILVGFTAGTAPDIVSRLLAERLAARWGSPVVVEDVTGAGGNIACDRVATRCPTATHW
jgi:tripartite-type tricarboxylate transporter receptor subunit TctC